MLVLTDKMISSFAEAEWMSFDLSELALDKTKAVESIQTALSKAYIGLNRQSTKEKRHQRFQIPDTGPEEYAERLIDLGSAGAVICGIRHLNLNPARPFIELRANFSLSGPDEVRALSNRVAPYFTAFDPKWIAVHARQPMGAESRNVYMVQRARVIQAMPAWPAEADIELRAVSGQGYFEAYRAGYVAFHERNSHLADSVPANPLEVMEESREAGLLYALVLDGRSAGLIAAVRADFLGHPGLYFNEIFISPPFTGKGLAKAFQRKFIAEKGSSDAIVWGTIAARNLPSYKTAIANQRRAIQYESFVQI